MIVVPLKLVIKNKMFLVLGMKGDQGSPGPIGKMGESGLPGAMGLMGPKGNFHLFNNKK